MKKLILSLAVIAVATMATVSQTDGQCTGCRGRRAARMNEWNNNVAQQTPWHGGYNYWRFNAPTALVVPPTAAYQTNYAWGVGQTRSMPIYHQFGTMNPGGGLGSNAFPSTPYLPSSTEQFGVYSVRAPWSHR